LKEKVALVESILRKGIPNAEYTSQYSGVVYAFRIDTENRTSWLYLDRKFLADNSPESITNLFNDYDVVGALQDEKQPQRLYFDGLQLVGHQQ
jgi:hypothetical protein